MLISKRAHLKRCSSQQTNTLFISRNNQLAHLDKQTVFISTINLLMSTSTLFISTNNQRVDLNVFTSLNNMSTCSPQLTNTLLISSHNLLPSSHLTKLHVRRLCLCVCEGAWVCEGRARDSMVSILEAERLWRDSDFASSARMAAACLDAAEQVS